MLTGADINQWLDRVVGRKLEVVEGCCRVDQPHRAASGRVEIDCKFVELLRSASVNPERSDQYYECQGIEDHVKLPLHVYLENGIEKDSERSKQQHCSRSALFVMPCGNPNAATGHHDSEKLIIPVW